METFFTHNLKEHQCVETKGAPEHPPVSGQHSTTKNYLSPNVNSSEVEKPCYSYFGGYFIDFLALIVF